MIVDLMLIPQYLQYLLVTCNNHQTLLNFYHPLTVLIFCCFLCKSSFDSFASYFFNYFCATAKPVPYCVSIDVNLASVPASPSYILFISTSPNACSTLSSISVSKYKSDNDATNSAVPLTAVPKPVVTPTANCPGTDLYYLSCFITGFVFSVAASYALT